MTTDVTKDVAPVRRDEEMDWPSLEAWFARHLPDLKAPMRVAQFHGGYANLTYCVSIGDREFVVRRPPHGTIAPGAHDMAREYQVLSGLAPAFDRAPKAIAFCDDASVIGAPFVVMERRHGVVARETIPESLRELHDVERRISFALIDAMAELHAIEPADVGLETLGRPDGFLERQLAGWRKRWHLSRAERLPRFDELHGRLVETRPRSKRHCIVHNDLKLDNCMFDAQDPDRVQSIFDWDMATLGEPLVELGTLLSYWREPSDAFDRAPTVALNMRKFPTRADLVTRYEQAGFDVERMDWYEAFALWKLAVVLQQLYRRFELGQTEDPRFERLERYIPQILEGAHEIAR